MNTLIGLLLIGCGEPEKQDSGEPIPDTDTTEEVPESFEVTGQILDDNGNPIAEANVMVGGRPDTLVLTDSDGKFALWYTNIYKGTPAIVASKFGYRARGYEFFKPDTPITISLREITGEDNTDYIFQEPGSGADQREENCSHCHTDFAIDFWTSKHSESASNPLLHDLYAGVTRSVNSETACLELGGEWKLGVEPGTPNSLEKCYVDHGVLSDLNPECGQGTMACDATENTESTAPTEFGGCADCHAPGIDGELTGRNLHDAVGLAYDAGIHCDTCHKVKDVDMSKPAGFGSRLIVHRPSEPGRNTFEWDPVYYGPIKDVPNVAMAASPQEKFNQAVFCAGCHEHTQPALIPETALDQAKWPDGLPVQSTYSEWKAGPYNTPDTPCQHCHMPSYVDKTNAVDIATVENQSITFGFPRPPEDVRQHIFRSPLHVEGEGEPRLIDTAVHLSIIPEQDGNLLNVSTSVANVGCGHAIPTGEPMRAMFVVIDVSSECGDVNLVSGPILDQIGGYRAMGTVDDRISLTGTSLTWSGLTETDLVGKRIVILRDSGTFDDYEGIGHFEEATLSPAAKGLKRQLLIGYGTILTHAGDEITIDTALNAVSGDQVFILDAVTPLADGMNSTTLTGTTGQSFAKVMIDPNGVQQAPHYRAIDILRDNRIAPGTNVVLNHTFEVPEGCTEGSIRAQMIYRPLPLNIAAEYGWETQDYIISETEQSWN